MSVDATMTSLAWTVLTGAGVALALALARRLGARHLRRLSARTDNRLDDALAALAERTHVLVLVAAGAWVGVEVWVPGAPVAAWVRAAFTLAILAQAGAWAGHLVLLLAERKKAEAVEGGRPGDATAWTALAFVARLAVWSVVLLLALDNVGVDVTALVAGLGVGGLAIGLAVQNVLGDIFASLSIVLDRPFAVGDFLVVDDVAGTVEHVGLKTTRVRALSGEQVVLSNAGLLSSRIRNFQRLERRRVVLGFGVLYETSPDDLAAVPGIVREVVEAQEATVFDRAHLFRFGDSSLDFEVVYALQDPDYNRHMDVQQAVMLGLFRRFAERGIGFAYPTRTLHVRHDRADEGELSDAEAARAGA